MHRRDVLPHHRRRPGRRRRAGSNSPASGRRKANLKLGTQHGDSDGILKVMAALGVNHICGQLPSAKLDQNWSVESLTRRRERVESFGLKLEAVPLPLSSAYITRSENPDIMLGKKPRARPRNRRHLPDDPQRLPGRHPPAEIQHVDPRGGAHGIHDGPRRRHLQHVQLRARGQPRHPDRSRAGQRRAVLGAHRLFREARHARGGGAQGAPGLPSARPRHARAARLSRRSPRARQRGRA
jgi:hypothetical protein